jgi:hypothetical protein
LFPANCSPILGVYASKQSRLVKTRETTGAIYLAILEDFRQNLTG